MDTKKINTIFKEQLKIVSLSKGELLVLKNKTSEIIDKIEANIKKNKIKAVVFIGGSFAKNTLIRKNKYDVDIFVRFDKKYGEEEIAKLIGKIVPSNAVKVHGSRDYYSLRQENIGFEIIPVLKINKPGEARNITDLSYFHVTYASGKIKKNPKLVDEIKIAKAFIYYANAYGAESYINGFSGYAVELLIIHYKSLINFIKAVLKVRDNEKIIIDDEKQYKNKEEIMKNMNEAKLQSPIILIDPTFKERNALSALSLDTFIKFKKACSLFLAKPSINFFKLEDKEVVFDKKYGSRVVKIEIKTKKQAGDIAGTKLKKFYSFFVNSALRFFDVKAHDFVYDENLNIGKMLIVCEQKKEIVFSGPPVEMKEQYSRFKKEHKNIKIIKGKAVAYEKSISFRDWFDDFKCREERVISSMDVDEINILS